MAGRSNRSFGIVFVLVVITLVLYAIGRSNDDGTAYDPESTKSRGTSAMVELIERNGVDVDLIRGAPTSTDGVALVLVDRFRTPAVDADLEFEDEVAAILEWVESGGTLVVADPSSSLLTTPVAGPYRTGLDCEIDALGSVRELGLETDDDDGFGQIEAVTFSASGGKPRCFFDQPGQAGIVADDLGDGVIVAFGFRELLTNGRIGDADHARLAVSLLAPEAGRPLVIIDGPSLLASGEETLRDLIPEGVKWGLGLAGFAFFVYAIGRSRRHGNPVLEPLVVEVSGSELVEATGAMLGRARQATGAGESLRVIARQDLAIAVGMPRSTEGTAVATILANRFDRIEPVEAQRILNGPSIEDDTQLLALANDINRLRSTVFGRAHTQHEDVEISSPAPDADNFSKPTDRTRATTP